MESGSGLWPGSPIVVEVLTRAIDLLLPHEVFVFGSNGDGFHGAGAAGLACRGDAANTWRQDEWFNKAMGVPKGDPARVGRWAVFGVARGFQVGRSGCSYAVQTIDHPGRKRSTPRREIYHRLIEFVSFARSRPDLSFVVTPVGEGYSGYSREEMAAVWRELHQRIGIPDTLRFIRLR